MITYSRGDVVLVGFVFSDETGKKLRPAALVSSPAYHRGRQEVIVAAITSNVKRRLIGDHLLADWRSAGLLFPSVVTGILRTVRGTMIDRRLGSLTKRDSQGVGRALRRALNL
ncbi:MAG: type II toxin-antitoxin system PemK/MazF family toxin [Candidatus Binatia bacterium]